MFSSEMTHILNDKTAESAHSGSPYDLDLIFRNMINAFIVWESVFDANGAYISFRFGYFNDAYSRVSGLKLEDVIGKDVMEVWPATEPGWIKTYGEVAVTGVTKTFDMYHEPTHGWYHCNAYRPTQSPATVCCIFEDITERLRAETEREKLRMQLAHAQRMDSIGRLAGGIAHDFNNMLNVILVNAESVSQTVGNYSPAADAVRDIIEAANHSSALTRQLLAFAQKQSIRPRIIDPDEVIARMMKMLRHLIGENIELTHTPSPQPSTVMMDPVQIEQILANLVINARDAVGREGRITIETSVVATDDGWLALHPGASSTDYVMIRITDNGHGMDNDTRQKLFEPFFTTKDEGKGTGLGLATVYGIVMQNDGFIDVESTPGKGSTFSVCIPKCRQKEITDGLEAPEHIHGKSTGTILLVEDEESLLRIVATMLRKHGYTVLPASTSGKAVHIAENHPGEIDLILTDVIMPEMNGKELADRLSVSFPLMKKLFMTGYSAQILDSFGNPESEYDFIEKPFSIDTLVSMIRELIERK